MKDGEFGVAVIGCGYWGMNYIRVFNELPESRIVAVCDKRTERLQEVNRRAPHMRVYSDLEPMLEDDGDIDAVVVCTEASTHYKLARRCIEHGVAVLIEKPITTSAVEAEKLTLFAEDKDVVLMVGHTFLYNAGIRRVKEYLRQQDPIYYLHACRTNLGPIRRDVNALWDLGTHDIAIFNYLLDSVPDWVSAIGAKVLRNCREDVVFLSLGYPGGIVGHIHVSWADPNKAREVVVVCGDKRIVFNDLNGMEQVRIFEKGVRTSDEPTSFGEYQLLIRDGDILSPRIEAHEPLKEQCRHFLNCIEHGSQPLTSGWNGRDVLRVLEAADRSLRVKGAQVEVERNDVASLIKAA